MVCAFKVVNVPFILRFPSLLTAISLSLVPFDLLYDSVFSDIYPKIVKDNLALYPMLLLIQLNIISLNETFHK